jgi:rhodanese-related sulfurtransferase
MNKFLFFAIVMLIGLINSPAFAADKTEIETITAETLKKMIDDKASFVLIDARRDKDYNEEHIISAINVSATDISSKTLAEVAPEVTTKLVFYCQNTKCQASHIAASKALGAGYKYLYEFSGGIEDWKKHGYPTVIAKNEEAK